MKRSATMICVSIVFACTAASTVPAHSAGVPADLSFFRQPEMLVPKTDCSFEADGVMRFDWKLLPLSDKPTQINKLFIEIPVRQECAELLANAGEPEKNGSIGRCPTTLGFSPSVVLRNSRVGHRPRKTTDACGGVVQKMAG